MTTNRSDFTSHAALAHTAALNAATARTLALQARGVAEARRLKAARSGLLARFWRYIGGAL